MMKKLLLLAAAALVSAGASAQQWEWETIPSEGSTGTYYLYSKNQNKFLNDNNGLDETPLVSWTIATSNGSGFPGSTDGKNGYSLTSSNDKQFAMYRSGSFFNYKYNVETNQTGKSNSDINLCSEYSDGYFSLCRSSKSDNWSGDRNVATTATGVQIVKDASIEWRFITLDEYNEFASKASVFEAYLTSYNSLNGYKDNPNCSSIAEQIQEVLDTYRVVNVTNLDDALSAIQAKIQECLNNISSALGSGTDVTSYIQNPGFDNMTGWNLDGFQQKKNEAKFGNSNCAEIWSNGTNNEKTSGKLSQVISNLPAGSYTLGVQGWGSFGDNTDYLYVKVGDAEPVKTNMPGVDGDPVNVYSVDFTTDGISAVEIGIARTENVWWTAVDNFTLSYKGEGANLSVKANKYGTFVAPFDVTLPDGVSAYTITINTNSVTLNEIDGDVVSANTPVIVKNESGADVTEDYRGIGGTTASVGTGLVGVLAPSVQITNGDYLLQNNEFHKYVSTDFNAAKNRCYIEASAVPSEVKTLKFFSDIETVIEEAVVETNASKQIYDLSGRRVNKAQKGLYIVNGKKVLY